jgi:hypothetical protein
MFPRQLIASVIIGLCLLVLIIRLVQNGRLDIAYCWLWLGIGLGMLTMILHYDWLLRLSALIGAVTPTTTIFLLGFIVVLLMCLQFSLVISAHRRQIKRLTQHIALLEKTNPPPSSAAADRAGPTPSAPS